MAYHIEYRPTTWEEVVGNKEIIASLKDTVKNTNRPHVYMFVGGKGLGKTTIARILAKEINTQNVDEINCSDHNGVDWAREFVKTYSAKGFLGDRFFILDEVHRLTEDAQNILLKFFEDTPSHVYVAICTTEPDKIKDTVRDRAVMYHLERPGRKDVYELLYRVAHEEKLLLHEDALNLIVKNSDGSIRNALTILEKIKGVDAGSQLKLIHSGDVQETEIVNLSRVLINAKNAKQIGDVWSSIKGDPESIRRSVVNYMVKVMVSNPSMDVFLILNEFENLVYPSRAGLIKASFASFYRRQK